MLGQELDVGGMAVLGCQTDCPIVSGMHVSAVLKQERNHISATIHRCTLQRRIVISMHICAVLDEERY